MFEGLADKAATETAPENTAQSESQVHQPTQENQETAPPTKETTGDMLDLQKLGKFRFEGQEMTYEDLKNSWLRHSDYTKKTQALAEEKKFSDNLRHDLIHVKKNPSLVSEFKKLYPEKYHSYLDFVIEAQKTEAPQNHAQLPPEILDKLNQHEQLLSSFQQEKFEAERAKIDSTLEAHEQKFLKKYPSAELGSVYHRLEAHVKTMRQDNPDYGFKDLNEKVIEAIYKADHDHFEKRMTEREKQKLKTIREVNARGADVPTGGGVPSQPASRTRLKDVADNILNSPEF